MQPYVTSDIDMPLWEIRNISWPFNITWMVYIISLHMFRQQPTNSYLTLWSSKFKIYPLTHNETYLVPYVFCGVGARGSDREEERYFTQPWHLKILVIQMVQTIEVPCTSLTRNYCISFRERERERECNYRMGNGVKV
jgi:hypothetical protein